MGVWVCSPTPAYAQTSDGEDSALAAVFKPVAGGLSADAVGRRASATSYQAKASEEALRGAAARVDAAWVAFLPRLSAVFAYERVSNFTPPTLGVVVVAEQPGPITPTTPLSAVPLSFPLVLDNWLFQATLAIPISDYFLRINEGYSAATRARNAARYDVAAARTKSAADGKVAFFNCLRARGAVVVAKLALADQATHRNDTRSLFIAGKASRVDVLRVETAVAAAELAVVQAQNFVELAEKQVRIAMHVEDETPINSAESIDDAPPTVQGNLAAFIAEAQSSRFEVRSIDANANALRAEARAVRAGAYPQLLAFGDFIYGNPNPRRFPPDNLWFPTWDIGARVTWSPNDVPSSLANGASVSSRAAALDAQRQFVRDGIALEVTQAFEAVREADFALGSTDKQLASAREAVRVARDLFKAGLMTSTTLTDAETELTRARLAMLNARVDSRTARVRLDHALGRDSKLITIDP